MRRILAGLALTILLLAQVGLVLAQPDSVSRTNDRSNTDVTVTIPEHAAEVAPGVFSLGSSTDVDGRIVEGLMIIDYKKGFGHKPNHDPGNKGGNGGGSKCFAFLARDAKWKTIEPWLLNPANTEGLSDDFLFTNLGIDIQKWEDAAATDILGDGSITAATLVADTDNPDGVNEVYFGGVGSEGAIAVTIVWGVFFGPPSQRELVEWDQVYDQVDFDWSSTGEADKMDFENIATHELGHSVGMGHPDDTCTEETMYRFADLGETKKRDLHTGDIAGIQDLYQ
ncbi:MAG: matrixin family metalloprotease [Thaumarchaeota archaeon]|nr:matrixin family metalloprotease [Nitrososphaerota archaeon]